MRGLRAVDEMTRFMRPDSRTIGHRPIALVRAFLLLLSIYVLGITLFCPIIAVSLPFVKKQDPVGRKFIDGILRLWSRLAILPFFKVKMTGAENLPPPEQTVVYVANHQSFMDILSSYHLHRSYKFISKASILKIPIVGWAMRKARTLTLDREDRKSQLKTFRDSVEALKSGTSLFVFPEGTRSKDGRLLPFKKGPFSMAKKAGVALVPITIRGTGRLMPTGKEGILLFHSFAGVELVVHPTVSAQAVQDMPDAELVASVRNTIESALPPSLRIGPVSEAAVDDA